MITVFQRPDPATRTAERPCFWHGEAIVDGNTYEAISRHSPAGDIARALIAAGVEDQPLQVFTQGIRGSFVWPSLYKAAAVAYEENSGKPLHQISYARVEAKQASAERLRDSRRNEQARVPASRKTGVNAPARYTDARESF